MKYNKGDEEAKTMKKMHEVMNPEPMEKMKPMVHLNSEDLPQIKKWQVGKTYKLEMKVRQTSMNQNEHGHDASFEVEKVKGY